MEITEILVNSIIMNKDLQSRESMCEETLTEYARIAREAEDAGQQWPFPPIRILNEWVVDGFHRLEVARRLRRKKIPAIRIKGSWQDAIRLAVSANSDHGLQRTNDDKRRAVLMALNAFPDLSNRSIAKLTKLSHTTINKYVKELRPEPKVEAASTCYEFHESYSESFMASIDSIEPGEAMVQVVVLNDVEYPLGLAYDPSVEFDMLRPGVEYDMTIIARDDEEAANGCGLIYSRSVIAYGRKCVWSGREPSGFGVCYQLHVVDKTLGISKLTMDRYGETKYFFTDWAFALVLKHHEYTRRGIVDGKLVFKKTAEEVFA